MDTCTKLQDKTTLKNSLQKLILKRLQSTRQAIDIRSLWTKDQRSYELTKDEITKVRARKAQNRLAAKKCREKSRQRIMYLEQEQEKLVEENKRLTSEIRKLKKEIDTMKK